MMFSILFVFSVFACEQAIAMPTWENLQEYQFEDYERDFQRTYPSEAKRAVRKAIYENRLQRIKQHNIEPHHTWKRGVNVFTDRTEAELKEHRGLNKAMLFTKSNLEEGRTLVFTADVKVEDFPQSFDWRDRSVITPVKNQGHCGACWAFASTETVESMWAIKTGVLQELSEQFVLDCTPNRGQCGGTGGCGGGTAELVYSQMALYGGMPAEWAYPYTSGRNGTAEACYGLPLVPPATHSGDVQRSANLTGMRTTVTNSYASMMGAIQSGPLAISVDAGAWWDYESGVFSGGNQTNPDLDHLVQLVGYGTDPSAGDYWIVRNSWGPTWGENGYILLKRSALPNCGIDVTPLDGNGCKGGPKTVEVCGTSGMLYDGVQPNV